MQQPFFNEQKDQSAVKAAIVAKYFTAWSGVMLGNAKRMTIQKLAYIDLFAGPGRYRDGAKSTPLMVLEKAIENPELARRLVTVFNDAEPKNVNSLRSAVDALPDIVKLNYPPQILCSEVDENAQRVFAGARMCPTFSFIDPFGYKGLSRGFIQAVVKDWGCDCVFFFNYNRINAGIANDAVRRHMDALFGTARIERMRTIIQGMSPSEREGFVLEELAQALRELGAQYILPFRFRRSDGNRTSHALVFVTKNPLGYEIMKGIMAGVSSTEDEGVPSFEYAPADARCPLLFSLNRPLETLGNDLLTTFSGKTIPMKDIYRRHNVGTPFIEKNYKKVLTELEASGKISAFPPAVHRPLRKGEPTFGNDVRVTFP